MNQRGLIIGILFLISIPFILAEEGCFTFKSSALYCYDLEKTDAQDECSTYSTCNFKESFFSNQKCENSIYFPQCQEIYCKSTCDYQYQGKCLGGPIPSGKEYSWCSPGCCQFTYNNQKSCTYQKNQWSCEIAAKNKGITTFNFDSKTTKTACSSLCTQSTTTQATTYPSTTAKPTSSITTPKTTTSTAQQPTTSSTQKTPTTTGLATQTTSSQASTITQLTSTSKTTTSSQTTTKPKTQTTIKSTSTQTPKKNSSRLWFWFLLVLILIAAFLYIAHQRNKQPIPKIKKPTLTKKPLFKIPSYSKPEEHHIKRKHHIEKKKKELFDIFGEPTHHKKTYVDLLEKVAHIHELKKTHWKKSQKERDFFQEVEKNIAKLKTEEIKKIGEKEAQAIFHRLKEIVDRK